LTSKIENTKTALSQHPEMIEFFQEETIRSQIGDATLQIRSKLTGFNYEQNNEWVGYVFSSIKYTISKTSYDEETEQSHREQVRNQTQASGPSFHAFLSSISGLFVLQL
jgi:hypothetical protein